MTKTVIVDRMARLEVETPGSRLWPPVEPFSIPGLFTLLFDYGVAPSLMILGMSEDLISDRSARWHVVGEQGGMVFPISGQVDSHRALSVAGARSMSCIP
jgi:hypothetical protein